MGGVTKSNCPKKVMEEINQKSFKTKDSHINGGGGLMNQDQRFKLMNVLLDEAALSRQRRS